LGGVPMADLAIERDEERQLVELEPAHAPAAEIAGVPALDGRCHVLPGQPLPGFSTPSAQAFLAVDQEDTAKKLYALITDPEVPFRQTVIASVRELGDVSVVKPVQTGSIDWPKTERRETFILLQQPAGEPLMASIDTQILPYKLPDIARNLMKPMVALLTSLDALHLAHRNIRPTNLYRSGSDGPIIPGEFYSAPAGFNQPSIFEPIERAMCPPAGRGSGEIADDLFALGVTTLFLALGKNPVTGVDDKTLLSRRAEMGSYAALTMDHKPPADLAPVIRSLMHDDRRDRWTLEDLSRWATLGVATQSKPFSIERADRGFEFAEEIYHSKRALALAFGRNWDAAREIVKTDAVERWTERSFKNREISQQIVDCRHSGSNGPRMVSNDLLLARTIITLDPDGPVRFRGLTVMPDGLGGLAALAATDTDAAAAFSEVISSQLIDFWLLRQSEPEHWAKVGKSDADKMLTYLAKSGPGFAIERCAYEMNKGMACQSPRFKAANAVQIRDLMEAIEVGVTKGEQNLDRHVAAFMGARYSGSIDSELSEFGTARDGEAALIAQLKIFAAVQFKHGPPELPKLAGLFLDHLDILLSPYQNVALRQRLQRAAEHVAPTGKLPELLGIVRNQKYLKLDKQGYDGARQQYRALKRQVQFEQDSLPHIGRRSLVLGRKAAAYLSVFIGMAVVIAVLGGVG
jgi:hypothetical protein